MTEILAALYAHQDAKYGDFISKLIPTLPRDRFIGVRSPEYKKIIKELNGCAEIELFLDTLPHSFFEEYALHSAYLCKMKDFDACLAKVEQLLSYVDNWAICDGLNPPIFIKHRAALKERLPVWLTSEQTYTRRFGLHTVMSHFLEEDFDPLLLEQAASLHSDEYYVNMMTAWLFAEALTKQWDATVVYLENRRLDRWTHNKAIQKAIESYRITDEQKEYLRTLRVK